MNTSYPPPAPQGAPRKLERSTSNRMIGGVCAGVADYLNLDPTLVRILTALAALVTGFPVVLYIVALFVMPEAEARPTEGQSDPLAASMASPSPRPGFPPAPPAAPAPDTGGEPDIWGSDRAPWEHPDSAAGGRTAEPIAPSGPDAPVVTPSEDSDGKPGQYPA